MSDLSHPSLDLQIVPRVRDLGGFKVQRVLPSARRKMVGPFIFLDRMGPALLTAGKGIAHSERTPADLRGAGGRLTGLQLWVALPRAFEDSEPGFTHHDRAVLPTVNGEGLRVRVVAGTFLGVRSPVSLLWETVLADVSMEPGAVLPVSAHHDERALYLTAGVVEIAGQPLEAGPLYVLKPGVPVEVKALTAVTLTLLGGEPMDGPRHIWWNFVSSSENRIEQARADWMAGRFDAVPGETERIDAPERPPAKVRG